MTKRNSGGLAAVYLAVAIGLCGCGEDAAEPSDAEGGAGGGPSQPACDEPGGLVDPTALVDDFEDGNGALGSLNGGWWVSSDGTEGIVTPPANATPPAERILGERCGSEFGLRVNGSGFTDWGVNVSAGLSNDTANEAQRSIDASSFRGVTFWARVGEAHRGPVRVQFQDSNTVPVGGVCDPEPSGQEQCYDGMGIVITPLDQVWRQYRIDFSKLSQRGFGHQVETLTTSALYTIEWVLDPNTTFDLWLDDVWFYE